MACIPSNVLLHMERAPSLELCRLHADGAMECGRFLSDTMVVMLLATLSAHQVMVVMVLSKFVPLLLLRPLLNAHCCLAYSYARLKHCKSSDEPAPRGAALPL